MSRSTPLTRSRRHRFDDGFDAADDPPAPGRRRPVTWDSTDSAGADGPTPSSWPDATYGPLPLPAWVITKQPPPTTTSDC